MKVLLIAPTVFFQGIPPMGLSQSLFYLYSYLRRQCPEVEVEVLELEQELLRPAAPHELEAYLQDVEALLARSGFDVVGISCYTTMNYPCTIAVARLCKQLNPEALVVVGGYHPTFVPESFDLPDRPVDFVVRGDGEVALHDIVTGRIPPGGAPQTVMGTSLPPEEQVLLWGEYKYHRTTDIAMARYSSGCSFSCNFCPDRLTGWRAVSPGYAIADLKQLIRTLPNVRSIYFTDPLFGLQKAWRDEFLELLRAADLPVAFGAQSRVDIIDKSMLDTLAGMTFQLDVGLESVVPEMLGIMKKSFQPERYLETFRELDDYMQDLRLPHTLNLILNYPGETSRTLDATMAFWHDYYQRRDQCYTNIGAHSFHLMPASEVWTNWRQYEEQYGASVRHPDWWREANLSEEASSFVIASKELAESRQIGRHREMVPALQTLSLAKMDRRAFEPFLTPPPPLAWADSVLLTRRREAYFDDKPLQLTDRAVVHRKVNGNALLYNFGSNAYFNCSRETTSLIGALLEEGQTIAGLADRAAAIYPNPEERRTRLRGLVVDLVANDFLRVGYPVPPEPTFPLPETRAILRTSMGDIELELFAAAAPRLVANFLYLANTRFYDSLHFLVPKPVDYVEIGSYSRYGDGCGYTLPAQATGHPWRRGAIAQVKLGTRLHGSYFRIARSDRQAGAGPEQAVFGRVTRGLQVLDALLTRDELHSIHVLAPAVAPFPPGL